MTYVLAGFCCKRNLLRELLQQCSQGCKLKQHKVCTRTCAKVISKVSFFRRVEVSMSAMRLPARVVCRLLQFMQCCVL